jgi:cytochrome P450
MRPAVEVYESAQTGLGGSRESILYKILTRDLDPTLKTPDAMQNEIIGNILAGTEAVANALLTITFHLLQSPGDCRRLKVELQNQPTGGESPFKVRTTLRRHSGMLMVD